jgi:hypothetical protein
MDDRASARRLLRGPVTAGLCTLPLALLHPHEAVTGPSTVLLRRADRALVAFGAALRRVLPRCAHPVGPAGDAPPPVGC